MTALLTMLLLAAPGADARWFPASARASFSAAVTTQATPLLGVDLSVLAIFGKPGTGPLPFDRQGWIFGAGLRGFLGAAPWATCDWCLTRQEFGPVFRLGYAMSDTPKPAENTHKAEERPTVPDWQLWVEASPIVVREAIPDAPLMPGGARLGYGVRVELGVTAVAWTLTVFKLVGLIAYEGSVDMGPITLPLFGLAFINQLGLWFEWNSPAVSMSTTRFGATIGASF
jgi:hypothetical protein